MKLLESTLPSMYSQHLHEKYHWDLGLGHLEKIYDILFSGAAEVLSDIKSTDRPAALIVKNIKGIAIAAGIIQYIPNEDESKPGNWSLTWTFDEENIPEGTFKVYLSDGQVQPYFTGVASNKYGIQFFDSASLENLFTDSIYFLRKWLDENVTETEEAVIEADGIFNARATVENGEKVFSIEVDGLIKRLIKDDASIEK